MYIMEDLRDKISVCCTTADEWKHLVTLADSMGWIWRSGESLSVGQPRLDKQIHFCYRGPTDAYFSVGGHDPEKKIVSPFEISLARPEVGDAIVSPGGIAREIVYLDGDTIVLKNTRGLSVELSLSAVYKKGYRVAPSQKKVKMSLDEIAKRLGVEKIEVI